MPENTHLYNTNVQYYKTIPLRLIVYTEAHFSRLKAKRFLILDRNNRPSGQNLWIPNSFLLEDGTINPNRNLDWLFGKPDNLHKLNLAGLIQTEQA